MNDLGREIARRQGLAWLALFWERLWPAAWPAVGVAGAFLGLALMGVPPLLGGWLHLALMGLFAAAFIAALRIGFLGLRKPTPAEARRRLELQNELAHRPLAVMEDRLSPTGDRGSRILWEIHVKRMRDTVRGLKVGLPHPGIGARDVFALRAVVYLLIVVGLAVAGTEGWSRIAQAMSPDFSPAPEIPARIDAWINPPEYTSVPPFQLQASAEKTYRVPQGSKLLARVYGGRGQPFLHVGATATPFDSVDRLNHELSVEITAGDQLRFTQEDRELANWPLEVVVDIPPEIALARTPSATPRGTLRIDYEARDDYGLVGAKAEFKLLEGGSGDVLERPLPLSALGARETSEASFHDLTPHPWAGMPVTLNLVAIDALGQEGRSDAVQLTLPERPFRHPVARAIIEQRKNLVRAPDRRRIVALALGAIAAAPESYDEDIVAFLALRTAVSRLRFSKDEGSLPEIIDLLWDTALRIEDGQLSIAERELRAAQQALMEALARGADDGEIERLMDQLQEAMQRYLQALAEQAARLAEAGQQPLPYDPQSRSIEAEQLQEMLERARELSRLGARDAAREMLRQLQEMLESLRSGPMMAMPPEMRGADRAIRELGDLMRDQQRLLDQTFRQSPRGRQRGLPDRGQGQQPGRDPMQGMQGMSDEQEGLRRRLGEIMRQLGEQFGEIPGALGRAERSMRGAREALGQGQAGEATESQGRAINQMAEGLRGLARELARQMGAGQGDETDGNPFDEDPLGRPAARGGMDTSTIQLPEKADLQRAREILDELRRRAGERRRPELERDYIDRLLERF